MLWYRTDDIPQYVASVGVPQGPVLGLQLWNIKYIDVLNLSVSEKATVLGYGDDVALLVFAKLLSSTHAKRSVLLRFG